MLDFPSTAPTEGRVITVGQPPVTQVALTTGAVEYGLKLFVGEFHGATVLAHGHARRSTAASRLCTGSASRPSATCRGFPATYAEPVPHRVRPQETTL